MLRLPLHRPAFFLAVAATISGVASQAAAREEVVRPEATAPSPFMGQWELDLTRMPSTYGPPPKRVVYGFQGIGDGKWRMVVDITGRDGSVRHMATSFRPDGTMAPSEGETSEADSAAIMTPAPNILVLNLARAKMLGSVRVYIVSANGQEMTESAAGLNGQGEPFVRNFHYKRLR
ncbi:hypothetical protein N4G62_12835 [Sphingomonas sanguinis]|uniref:LuxR family transcriptional regulator n=1 Tax=Sphingomonas sanguinis TaxID=33051 RepID=A0ABU5LSJ9_9SPHN|nr:hypothetical protein [Sphingomonas sanguinis]MDZ7282915.1 hypothetical protein [Sphingomonas sanguinis]